jgi:hypothetical protein
MELQRRSQVEKEMREMSAKYNMDRVQLEGEIKRLREILEGKGREIDDWRAKVQVYETRTN